MRGKRVLVTGGAGFIGSTIVDRLVDDGHSVTVVDDLSAGRRRNLTRALTSGHVEVHELDIRSSGVGQLFARVRPEVVMHLAAQIDVRVSVQDPRHDADLNIMGTLNVLENARTVGVRKAIVASSGGCVYGEARTLPIRETFRGRPVSPYGISKRVLHDYLAFYRRIRGLDSVVLALSNVYGPRQDSNGEAGVVAIFLRAMLQGAEPVIFGAGTQTRDFVYVEDVADGFVRAMDRGSGVFNLGTKVETSVLDLWHACAKATGFSGTARFAPARPGELEANALDPSKAARGLGWTPTWGLDRGVAATAAAIADEIEEEAAASVG